MGMVVVARAHKGHLLWQEEMNESGAMVVYGYTYMRSVALVMRNGVVTNADGLLYIMTIRRLLPYETDG